jgi:hypothetical protein
MNKKPEEKAMSTEKKPVLSRRRRIPIEEIGEPVESGKASIETLPPKNKTPEEESILPERKQTKSPAKSEDNANPAPVKEDQSTVSVPMVNADDKTELSKVKTYSRASSLAVPENTFEFERDWRTVQGDLEAACHYFQVSIGVTFL